MSDQQSLRGDLMSGYMCPSRFYPELGKPKMPANPWLLEGNPIEASYRTANSSPTQEMKSRRGRSGPQSSHWASGTNSDLALEETHSLVLMWRI